MNRAAGGRLNSKHAARLVAFLVVLGLCGAIPFLPRFALLNSFQDDAFYYLQIARNVAAGQGFTFDGLHRTNGFHPLWLFTLIPLTTLPGEMLTLRLAALLQVALVALACAELVSVLRPRVGGWPAVVAALSLLVLPGSQLVLFNGMETALLFWLLIRVWRCWSQLTEREDAPPKAWLMLGLWCSLAFLSRLEAGFVTPLIVLLSFPYWRRRRAILLAVVAIPISVALAYFAWSYITFEIWVPISGIVKSLWGLDPGFGTPPSFGRRLLVSYLPLSQVIAATRLFASRPQWAFLVYCVGLVVLAVFALRFRKQLWRQIVAAGIGVPLAICACLWLVETVSLPFNAPWYPIAPFVSTALVIGALTATSPRVARILAVGLILLGVRRTYIHTRENLQLKDSFMVRSVEAAEWARSSIPLNDRIGSWNAGVFAYFSHRHVINLDGLVNDIDYYRRVLVGRQFAQYVADEKIAWLADAVFMQESLKQPRFGVLPYEVIVSVQLAHEACEWKGGFCNGFAVWQVSSVAKP